MEKAAGPDFSSICCIIMTGSNDMYQRLAFDYVAPKEI